VTIRRSLIIFSD